jgi:hypothetical protein
MSTEPVDLVAELTRTNEWVAQLRAKLIEANALVGTLRHAIDNERAERDRDLSRANTRQMVWVLALVVLAGASAGMATAFSSWLPALAPLIPMLGCLCGYVWYGGYMSGRSRHLHIIVEEEEPWN